METLADDIPPASRALREELAIANEILFDQELNDGFGHVSARHDRDAQRYVMLRDLAPGEVDPETAIEFDLESRPIPGRAGSCKERYIHGEIYRARPDVHAIVHTHAVPMILFSVVAEPLRPIYQMAYFLDAGAPLFEVRDLPDRSDLLVSTPERGAALARTLGPAGVVLMRGHGASVVGASLKEAIYRTIYAAQNAALQRDAWAFGGATFLDATEIAAIDNANAYDKAWRYWAQRAKRGWTV